MIALSPSEKMKAHVKEMADEIGALKGSTLKGAGNYCGLLGEMACRQYLSHRHKCDKIESYSFDLMVDGLLAEVKTKQTTVAPRPEYIGNIHIESLHQKPDIYIFCRYNRDRDIIYLISWIERDDFLSRADQYKAGEIDPVTNFLLKKNSYCMAYGKMNKIETIHDYLHTRNGINYAQQ